MINFIAANANFIIGMLCLMVLLLLFMVLMLYMSLSNLKGRFRKMMYGVDGGNLEKMITDRLDELTRLGEETQAINKELRRQDEILKKAVTKTGVVRFCAFEDMGSDLSYAVAMLNSHDDGVVFSSIFGRDDSRSYAKPIEKGASSYTLTDEELSAIKEAKRRSP